MKKTILALVLFVLMITPLFAASVDIGDGTTTTSYIPFFGLYDYGWSHFIIPGDGITNAIDITEIEFDVANTPNNYIRVNQVVYIRLTTETTVTTAYNADPVAAGFTEIYNGSVTWNGSGWQGIQLTTPFAYDGTSNLEIIWENGDGDYLSGPNFYKTDATEAGAYKYADNTFPAVDGSSAGYYPNTRLTWQIEGEPDAPVLVSPISGAINLAIDTDLEWTTGENTDHAVLYLADNADFTDASVINPATSPYTTSLTNGTTYFWKVVAVSSTDVEMTSVVNSFTTEFGTISDFPWTEGFENPWVGSPATPNGWGQIAVSGTNVWSQYTYSPHTGSASARAPWASAGGEHLLITPAFDFDASTDYRLKFWLKGSTSLGTDLKVQIANSYTDESSFTTDLADYVAGTNMPSTWTEQIISLAGYSGNQAIAFRMIDDNGYSLYIDDVTIEEIPATPIVEITTDPIDFGTTPLNNSSDSEIVSIQNIGGGTLNITDVSITGTDADQFSYTDSEDYILDATEDLLVEVTFNPTSAGAKTATLQITDDLTREVYEIALTGTGFDPNIYEIDIPYSQDFETEEAFLGWTSNVNSTNTNVTSDLYNGTAQSGSYSYRAYNSGDETATTELISPLVVPDMDAYRVRFWAKKSSSTNTQPLVVGKYNQVMDTFTAYSTIDLTTTYAEYTVNMDAPVRANERIAFQFSFTGTYQNINLDDLVLEEVPAGALIQITPAAHDFGEIYIGAEAYQTFTVSNNGVLATVINQVEAFAGYTFQTSEATPFTLEPGTSLTIDVTFAPLAEMVYSGNLRVKENDSANPFVPINHDVALTGSGIPVPQGNTCLNPLELTFPAVDITGNTGNFGDDYSSSWVTPSSSYLNGDDVVYQFTLANTMLLNGTITTTGSWMGAFLLEEEPNIASPAAVTLMKTSSSGNTLTYTDELIAAGTYYLIISTYPTPQSIDYTINLTAEPIPAPAAATSPSPAHEAIDQLTALTLGWTNANYTDTIDLWFGAEGARAMTKVLDNVAVVEEWTTPQLTPNTTYNWKVVSRNNSGETPAEEIVTWSFTTIGSAPEAVEYSYPADAANDVSLSGNISWQFSASATGYYVYFSTDETFATTTPVDQATTSYAFSGLEYSTTYYWKVIPYNIVGSATEGILVWSFTTMSDPTITMPVTINFEGSTDNPAEITEENFLIGVNHGSTSNIMYKNIYSTGSNGYIQFQAMNNITATSIISFDYRVVAWSSPYPAIAFEEGHDYLNASVSVDNGETFSDIDQINSTNHIDSADMATFTIDIGAYASQTAVFRFDMIDDTVNDYYFDIDNIYFGEPATTPIANLSVTEVNFGDVELATTSSISTVIVSNGGPGVLTISNVEITGNDSGLFAWEYASETPDFALENNDLLTINVTFSPDTLGDKEASLVITDDLGRRIRFNSASKVSNNTRAANVVALTGTGWTPLQGTTFNNPLPLSFPADDVTGNTADYGDDYDSDYITGGSHNNYMNGDDVVYQFTVDTDVLLNGTIVGDATYLGAFILEDAPNLETPAQVVHSVGASSSYSVTYTDVAITAGTYYFIISTWASPQSVNYTINLDATLPAPEIPVNFAITTTGANVILSWEAVDTASSYYVFAADTPDGTYALITDLSISGTAHEFEATDTMKFYKVKASTNPVGSTYNLTPAKGFNRRGRN